MHAHIERERQRQTGRQTKTDRATRELDVYADRLTKREW